MKRQNFYRGVIVVQCVIIFWLNLSLEHSTKTNRELLDILHKASEQLTTDSENFTNYVRSLSNAVMAMESLQLRPVTNQTNPAGLEFWIEIKPAPADPPPASPRPVHRLGI